MKMWGQFLATGNQRQAFSKRIIQAPIATGKETNTALSYEHPEIPNSSWFARQHDPFLFCLSLSLSVVSSKATAEQQQVNDVDVTKLKQGTAW